jgi:hypothetical protein
LLTLGGVLGAGKTASPAPSAPWASAKSPARPSPSSDLWGGARDSLAFDISPASPEEIWGWAARLPGERRVSRMARAATRAAAARRLDLRTGGRRGAAMRRRLACGSVYLIMATPAIAALSPPPAAPKPSATAAR